MKCFRCPSWFLQIAGIVATLSLCLGAAEAREPVVATGPSSRMTATQPRQQRMAPVASDVNTSLPAEATPKQIGGKNWLDYWSAAAIVTLFTLIFGVYQCWRRNSDAFKKKIVEKRAESGFELSLLLDRIPYNVCI